MINITQEKARKALRTGLQALYSFNNRKQAEMSLETYQRSRNISESNKLAITLLHEIG